MYNNPDNSKLAGCFYTSFDRHLLPSTVLHATIELCGKEIEPAVTGRLFCMPILLLCIQASDLDNSKKLHMY